MVGGLLIGLRARRERPRRRGSRYGVFGVWLGLWVLAGAGPIAGWNAQAAPDRVGDEGAEATTGTGSLPEMDDGDLGGVSLWDHSVSLRSWAGYRDNPQLSAVNPVGSAFLAGGGEIMAFRLPIDGWEASFYGLFEHLGYFESGLSPETTGVMDARVKRVWGDGWIWGAALEYYFLKQVFDASELVGVRVVIPTEGHTLAFRPLFGREIGKVWRWELEPEVSRQWLAEPLDSFLDTGARLQWIRKIGGGLGSEVGVSYRFRNRAFDERPPRNEAGDALPGTLAYRQHEWESVWKATWDARRRWRTTLRGGYLLSHDNEGGYFDYERFQISGQVRYSSDRWEVRAEARTRWYMYAAQRAYEPDGPRRRRVDVSFQIRGDWKISRRWRVFVQFEDEMSDENMVAVDYRATGLSGGMEFEL